MVSNAWYWDKKFARDIVAQKYMAKMSRLDMFFQWIIDSKTRKAVYLNRWIKGDMDDDKIVTLSNQICEGLTENDDKMLAIMKWVRTNIRYVGDITKWKYTEKWQEPTLTLIDKTGDCEDQTCLVYVLAYNAGVPNHLMRIVAGDVKGGGHAYVVYRSDNNLVEFPIDSCYNYSRSIKLQIPYVDREDYYYGNKEWFSFNSEGLYNAMTRTVWLAKLREQSD